MKWWVFQQYLLRYKTDVYVQAEARVVAAFKEFVIKLNEAAFKPLFRRLYDWAFAGDKGMSSLYSHRVGVIDDE